MQAFFELCQIMIHKSKSIYPTIVANVEAEQYALKDVFLTPLSRTTNKQKF